MGLRMIVQGQCFFFKDFLKQPSVFAKPHLARRRLKILTFSVARDRKFPVKIASRDCLKLSNKTYYTEKTLLLLKFFFFNQN